MNRAGIVIVTYNSEREIGPCLDALPAEMETVVVDNASSDATLAEVRKRPSARLVANPWNRGFAAAVNQGIGALDCELALLLNPDVEVVTSLEPMAAQFELQGVAAATGKLVGRTGRPQAGFMVRRLPTALTLVFENLGINRLWPGNPVNRSYRCFDLDPEAEAFVEQPAGAFLMVRRDVWRELGGFDESFFPVWFEDVDFAKRVATAGYKMRYTPLSVAKHSGGHSVGRLPRSTKDTHWYGNLLRYTAKHLAGKRAMAVLASVMLGSVLRALLALLLERRLDAVVGCVSIIRLAGAGVFSGRRD